MDNETPTDKRGATAGDKISGVTGQAYRERANKLDDIIAGRDEKIKDLFEKASDTQDMVFDLLIKLSQKAAEKVRKLESYF
ncbi:hypothetical protein LEP1GSC170_1192 [Leptospira interrogans serovar Bataviae str. HAI135]|nr:hypothetical protein LEP1GSC170_1192 [Leptospira interrogans serovar Bataviae str. HAI135]